MNNIDQLFRDTLQEHTSTPSAGLWERVEPGLHSTTDRKIWIRWAAVVVPVLLTVGIWMNRQEEAPVITAVVAPSPAVDLPKITLPEVSSSSTPRKNRVGRKQVQVATIVSGHEPVEPFDSAQDDDLLSAGTVQEVVMPEEITIEPVSVQPEPVVAEPKPIVLVYTLESIAVPGNAERKETSLDRVVEFARTVKHSDPIGDIRGLKDEMFAFDFRKKQTKKH